MDLKVKAATKWSFMTEVLAKFIVPLTNIILARLLTPDDFGLIATINMVISFTDVLTESGFTQYIIQHDFDNDNEYSHTINVAFWSNFSVSMLIFTMITVFSVQLSRLVGSPGSETPLVIACISIPVTSFSSIPIAILQKKYDYKGLFYNRIVGSLTPLVVSSVLAFIGFGYWALIIGTLLSNVVKAVILIIKSKWHPVLYFNFEVLKNMLGYSIWILLEAIVMWACTWIDIFIVGRVFGTYYTGLYKTAQTTVTGVLSVVTASVNSIVFVTLSKLKNDKTNFDKFLYEAQQKLAILVVPMGVGIFIFSDFITSVLLGSQWTETADFIGIWGLCMAYVAVMGTFCREALRAKGMPKVSLVAQSLHLVFVILVMIIIVPAGYYIMIYVRSIAYLEIILLLHIFVKVNLHISPLIILQNTIWPTISAVVMGLFGYWLKYFLPKMIIINIALILLCIVVYFGILMLYPKYRNLLFDMGNGCIHKRGKND